jgi:hypothetical protein
VRVMVCSVPCLYILGRRGINDRDVVHGIMFGEAYDMVSKPEESEVEFRIL